MSLGSIWFCVLLFAAAAGAAPTSQPASQPANESSPFHAVFTESAPLSTMPAQHQRYGLKVDPTQRYTLSAESFEVYVPPDAAQQSTLGLLVWVSSGNRGAPGEDWLALLDRHHLIWIGANNAGNDRGIGVRVGLAIDAAFNLKKRYKIDDTRIYVAGVSGGGKMASLLAVAYPDVFTGAIPICGVIYFRSIPLSNDPRHLWPAAYIRPGINLFDRARQNNRFVLITGERDMNRDSVKDIHDLGFLKDRFAHVDYVEVPGMGHGMPEMRWIDQALDTLDSPLAKTKAK